MMILFIAVILRFSMIKIVPAALNFVLDDRHIGGGAGDKHLLSRFNSLMLADTVLFFLVRSIALGSSFTYTRSSVSVSLLILMYSFSELVYVKVATARTRVATFGASILPRRHRHC